MIVGSAVNAKMNPLGSARPTTSGRARSPKTNCEPALVNSRNWLTSRATALKNSYPGLTPAISSFRMSSARASCRPMPQTTVRTLTARRLVEHAAATSRKHSTPAAACARPSMAPCSR